MLAIPSSPDERLTAVRRSKFAYVYVRQSSINQVRHHQESTELQYSLVDRAVRLGWPPDRVVVIDEDLGKSGNGQVERGGFQRLIAEIGLGNAGLVVSLDASRLARNNRDWHQLLELCSLFGVVIADGERLYDPCAYHDRLLLGLSGIMSEAELHQIRIRLHQGERQKAARGELRIPLPGGLAYNRSGQIVFNPDEEVQARLRLIFDKFRELQTARRVMRYLRTHDLRVPVRPLRGPAPHELVWRDATIAHVHYILHNPAYAGAYVYGRRRINAVRQGPGSHRATSKVAIDDWDICIKDAHPGYINWEEFMANQRRLADNTNRYEAGHRGAPRKGIALLQGLAVCGQCGRRMTVRYSGPDSACPVYCCLADRNQTGSSLCQEVRAPAVDEQVARILLKASNLSKSPSPSLRSTRLRRKRGASRNNGRYGGSARGMTPNGLDDNTTPWNRKIVSSPEPWKRLGKTSCAWSMRSSRNIVGGETESPWCYRHRITRRFRNSPRICRPSGTRKPPSQKTANVSCASSCRRWFSTRKRYAARSSSGFSGRPAQPANIKSNAEFNLTIETMANSSLCVSGSRNSMRRAIWTGKSPKY